MKRKNRFDTFKAAPERNSYDEFPMLELGIDPQMCLSRNTVVQPFFLICEQDTVLAQVAGEARVEFRNSSINYFNMVDGDFVYVPGGTPHRIVPKTASINLRYKAEFPGLEAVAWYPDKSDEEISRVTWDCADELPQEGYLRACQAFNADPKMRTAANGQVLPPIDLGPFHWAAVAAEVRETEAAEQPRLAAKADGRPNTAQRRSAVTIPLPDDSRPPMLRNVYLFSREATAALAPLFPYTEPGSIVPCTTLHELATSGPIGYFMHSNTVQEINISFGTRDGYQQPGLAMVGPYRHGVGQKPGQENLKMMNLSVITQRQAVGVPQHEIIAFACEKCENVLYEHAYGAHEFPEPLEGRVDRAMIGIPTSSSMAVACKNLNDDEGLRTCKKCGHVNPPVFPTDYWGFQEYKRRTHIIAKARETMRQAAEAALVS
jgi:3-hydroxyanthranilate 3,4-dioxygenase